LVYQALEPQIAKEAAKCYVEVNKKNSHLKQFAVSWYSLEGAAELKVEIGTLILSSESQNRTSRFRCPLALALKLSYSQSRLHNWKNCKSWRLGTVAQKKASKIEVY